MCSLINFIKTKQDQLDIMCWDAPEEGLLS